MSCQSDVVKLFSFFSQNKRACIPLRHLAFNTTTPSKRAALHKSKESLQLEQSARRHKKAVYCPIGHLIKIAQILYFFPKFCIFFSKLWIPFGCKIRDRDRANLVLA